MFSEITDFIGIIFLGINNVTNNVENVWLSSQQIVVYFEGFIFYCNQLKCILFAEYNNTLR